MPKFAARGLKQSILAIVAAAALFPIYVMVTAAFKSQSDFLERPFEPPLDPSLRGFETALGDEFPRWLANSAMLTVGSVAATLLLASLAGWGFAHWRFRGKEVLLAVVVSLMVVPPVVLLVPLFLFGVRLGWISSFHLVILIYVGLMLPFSTYLLASFFKTIPASMLEAARMDGASSVAVFRTIVLPLSKAPLMTLAVVNFLWAWNELIIALVFLQSEEKKTLMVGITGFQGRYNLDVPVIMAGLTLAALPIMALYLFGLRFFTKGLVVGATKG